jgi:hypothetical protein
MSSRESQEYLAVRESKIDGAPDKVCNECSSSYGEEELENCFDEQVISACQDRPYELIGDPEPPVIISKEDWIAVDEDMVVGPTVRFPGYRDEDLPGRQEELNKPSDEVNDRDFCRSRAPTVNDDQYLRPLVRLPEMDDFRLSGTAVSLLGLPPWLIDFILEISI